MTAPGQTRKSAQALRKALAGISVLATAMAIASPAHAEGKIRIAQQFGIAYLILDVVNDQKLVEKHGRKQGLDIDVEWAQISGATAMNESLLAGAIDIVSAGVPPMLTLWDRTHGKQNVKAIAALGSLPNYLVTNNPNVKKLQDLSDKDRIAVPAAGVGFQSRTLQIETARLFGPAEFKKYDKISVSLAHPDATSALIAGGSEITTHFASAPFYYQSLAGNKNVRKVLSSYDILGGKATFNVVYTTQKFNEQNPKTYQAFYDSLAEAAEIIRTDKKKAAEIFIRVQKSKLSPELVQQIIEDPENDFTIFPHRTYVYAEELHKLGILKNKAASWKDYFFGAAYANPGS